ncbi:MAG: hypothetical protein C0592_06315 [Marinilabiliales bacterium]|nr:MAG: hypothetical protein C0592_06315 [Marinilabiliales bacterium]
MKFKMFHVPKPRKFGYTPIYYNPEEEETVTGAEKKNSDSARDDERANRYWQRDIDRITRKKTINITMYIIIAILLTYLIIMI